MSCHVSLYLFHCFLSVVIPFVISTELTVAATALLSHLLQSSSVGIHPQMFKTLVGNGHREFSTKQQQDAHEFLLHLLTLTDVSSVYVTHQPLIHDFICNVKHCCYRIKCE